MITIRLLVSVWLIVLSIWGTVKDSPWFLLMLAVVGIHLLLALPTAYGMRGGAAQG